MRLHASFSHVPGLTSLCKEWSWQLHPKFQHWRWFSCEISIFKIYALTMHSVLLHLISLHALIKPSLRSMLACIQLKLKWHACCSLNEDSFDIFISLCNWFVPLLVEMFESQDADFCRMLPNCWADYDLSTYTPSFWSWWSQFGVTTVSRPLISLVVHGINEIIDCVWELMRSIWSKSQHSWHDEGDGLIFWVTHRIMNALSFFVLVWWYDITVFWLWR